VSGDSCQLCDSQLDEFGQCMTCDTYGTPADQRAEKTEHVLTLVATERAKQDAKWGPQNHNPLFWLAILGEEFGEVSKEVVEAEAKVQAITRLQDAEWTPHTTDKIDDLDRQRDEHLTALREELIQTAAVCVAMLESLERNQGVTL
jgi:hypothetical protein